MTQEPMCSPAREIAAQIIKAGVFAVFSIVIFFQLTSIDSYDLFEERFAVLASYNGVMIIYFAFRIFVYSKVYLRYTTAKRKR